MGLRTVSAGVVLAILLITSASATVRIQRDRGGQIGHYLDNFAMIRDRGETVMIDGPCLSACTLVLGIVPPDRICVTSRARLGFHAAWRRRQGETVISGPGTRLLWQTYPHNIRAWIQRRGGLSRRMIYLRGRELRAMYRPCP
jgi:hypothetical protein